MGIAKAKFNEILGEIFAKGNQIHLFTTMPDPENDSGMIKVSGSSYIPYTIKEGDFTITSNTVKSAQNMMFYLCEEADGHGVAVGFGVYNNRGVMVYYGEFKDSMPIPYNHVPTIKKYDGADEGLFITLTSTEVSATAE